MADTGAALAVEETPASAEQGLTAAEVRERVARGETNAVKEVTSRSYFDIFRANVFTRFNAILGTLFVLIVIFGSLRDGLFGLVLVANALIGIIQETRAKRTLDKLYLLSAPKANVVRDGETVEIPTSGIVKDDVVALKIGDQVSTDGSVLVSEGLELDESLLTGESVPVEKNPDDEVLSGSFVVAGSGRYVATGVGEQSYARKLEAQAKRFELARSELRDGVNMILKYLVWIMVPLGVLLLLTQLFGVHAKPDEAITGTVAGLVGMVPEGLVLLTSLAFAVSVISLARRNVLVQELPAVEGLARVDIFCADKTGTLTEGKLTFNRFERLDSAESIDEVLGAFGADESARNTTLEAIAEAFPALAGWAITDRVPFSSARKWSANTFEGHGTWYLGAPEMLLESAPDGEAARDRVEEFAGAGWRVLLLARCDGCLEGEKLPDVLHPAALLLLEEKIRPDAKETLGYFEEEGVNIKVISGDNPVTVGAVAERAGVKDVGEPRDARKLPAGEDELATVLEGANVFGRVTPDQKEAMVGALQSRGHVVAMTGDGVNDALALKKADVGVAMGSGSPATRAIAKIVLLDSKFATMPGVVAEGRRIIGNIERVASLFLTKTVYATILVLATATIGWKFPLMPRHLTLLSALTIGAPAFVLSFAPNKQRYRPGFVPRVMRFTLPAGLIAAMGSFAALLLVKANRIMVEDQGRMMVTLVLGMVGLWVLAVLARPYNWWKVLLVGAMVLGFILAMVIPFVREFFAMAVPPWYVLLETIGVGIAAIVVLELVWKFTGVEKQLARASA